MDNLNQPTNSPAETLTPEQTFGDNPSSGGNNSPVESQTPQQQTPSAPSASPSQPVITPEAIAAAVRAAMPTPPPAAPTPPSPEDVAAFEKQFNVVRVTPEMYKAILGVAPQSNDQLKALEQALHGSSKQAIAMATYIAEQKMQQHLERLQSQMQPMQEFLTQQQTTKLEQDFFAAHGDLKDHEALVKEVALATKAQNIPFKSREEAFKFVADKARSLLGKAAPAGQPASNRQQSGQPARKFNMTPTSLGGNPGTGRSPQAGANISPKDVFANEPG